MCSLEHSPHFYMFGLSQSVSEAALANTKMHQAKRSRDGAGKRDAEFQAPAFRVTYGLREVNTSRGHLTHALLPHVSVPCCCCPLSNFMSPNPTEPGQHGLQDLEKATRLLPGAVSRT